MSDYGPGNQFAESLNINNVLRRNGSASFIFKARTQDLNPQKNVHGGIIAGLMDLVMALAAGSHVEPTKRKFSLTLSLNINFISAAGEEILTCKATETGGGEKTVFCDGRIENERGLLIASAQGAFKLLPPGSETSSPKTPNPG